LGNLPSTILWTWPYHVSWFCSISFTIVSPSPICCLIVTFLILSFLHILEDILRASISVASTRLLLFSVGINEIFLSSKLSRDTLRSQEQCSVYGISFMYGLSQSLATVLGFHIWWSEIKESVLYWASTSPASLAECSCNVQAAFSLSWRKWWGSSKAYIFLSLLPRRHSASKRHYGVSTLWWELCSPGFYHQLSLVSRWRRFHTAYKGVWALATTGVRLRCGVLR
jgi:hypothetical protein